MGTKARAFKHSLGPDRVRDIARGIAEACPGFDADTFTAAASQGLAGMELKARVNHIIGALHACLPQPFPQAAQAIVRSIEADGGRREGDERLLRGFAAWPLIDYVGAHGLAHPTVALATLRRITSRFSAEFAVRPFLERYPDQTLAELESWTADSDEHVRRLVSEGCRPLLPWGQRLQGFRADPSPVLALLERLRDDPAQYVRRSVANNLNDIAKDHPARVVSVCRRWLRGADHNRTRLVKHGLRSLIKAGNLEALALLGFGASVEIEVTDLAVSPSTLREGGALEIDFRVRSTGTSAQNLAIDYAVHFVKSHGKRSPKVFKLKTLSLGAGQRVQIRKKHSLKPVSVRVHYPGIHLIEILINGACHDRVEFELRG